jgi:hypothetical protein
MYKKVMRLGLVGALALTIVGAATAASASVAVERRGSCSTVSDWKLKAKPDDGRFQVEYEVESNRGGEAWNVRILQNGTRVFSGTRITGATSHSFGVKIFRPNTAGTDKFTAKAQNTVTGETCSGSLSI